MSEVLLKIDNLKKRFGKLEVLKGLSTEIRKGEVVVMIGPSGGGKSTFLRCMNLLEQPTEGSIDFEGVDIEPNYNQAVNELNAGAVDAVAMDVGVAKKKMADLPGKFEILTEIVMTETYGIGFKKGNTALKDEVEAELKKIFEDGTGEKIAEQYKIEKQALLLLKK